MSDTLSYDDFCTALRALHLGMAGVENFVAGGVETTYDDLFNLAMVPFRTLGAVGLGLGDDRAVDPDGRDHLVLAATHRLAAAILVLDRRVRDHDERLIDAVRDAGREMGELVLALLGRYVDHAARWEAEVDGMVMDFFIGTEATP